MEADHFRSALRTRPFRPFSIRTASGAAYEVQHPETAAISPSGRTVVVLVKGEEVAIIDAASISEVVVSPGKSRKRGGGG